jgi:hypothetical protein
MPNTRPDTRVLGAALALLLAPAIVGIAPAHGAPVNCKPATTGDDNVCIARLTSVTANTSDGTITGTPVGSQAPVTLWGQADAYLKSDGFTSTPPDPVQQWDAAIDASNANKAELSGPNWYGAAKERAFLPRTLNGYATQFPPSIIVARFVPDDTHAGWFQLVSIQPMAQ